MTEKQFFPASIVDETAYFMEGAVRTSITGRWILTLTGEVNSKVVREALDACLNFYPKFKCILVKNYPSVKRLFRYCWEYRDSINSGDILREVESPDMNHSSSKNAISYYSHDHFSHYIDITRQAPVKVFLIRQPKQVNLIFFIHHTASDGIGFLTFIKRFIQFYEEIFYHRKKEDNLAPDFKAISQPEIKSPWRHFLIRHFYNFLRKKALFLREPAVQVHTHGGEGPSGKLQAVAQEIPPHQFKILRTIAQKYQATLNDYLLATMFQTIKKWNKRQCGKLERFYVHVPVNLRSQGDFTVGNIFSGFDISPEPDSIDNKKEMLNRIREEIIFMRENDVERTIVNLAWLLKSIPLALKTLMFKHHTHAFYPSICLSNLGICDLNPSHIDEEGFHYMGSARICSITVFTAAIPWPQVVLITYNDRMSISLSVCRSHFSLEAAEKLLDSFVRELIE